MTLRPYQSDFNESIRAKFREGHQCVLGQMPTGAGKTVAFCSIVQGAAAKNKRTWIVVHRGELLDQASRKLTENGVYHGVIQAGKPMAQPYLVQVATIQTLVRRLDMVIPPELIVVDEAHHQPGNQYKTLLATYPNARVIGVTATPERLDGRGLNPPFTAMVRGPEMSWLISEGFLARPKYLSIPVGFDDTDKKLRCGDFKPEDTVIMEKPKIIGDIVAHYQKHAAGLPAIAFCRSVHHAEVLAETFTSAGVKSASIDGAMDRTQRREILSGLRSGEISVLTSCELVSEGFDLPAVSVAILARPTASLGLYLQQVGRALRPSPGKDFALCLDHVGNVRRHGLAEMPREWCLDGAAARRKATKRDPVTACRQCPQCYAVHSPAFSCPECGYDYRANAQLPEHADGELVEIKTEHDELFMRCVRCSQIHAIALDSCDRCGFNYRKVVSTQKRQEIGMTKDFASLVALGKQRGYKSPEFWAKKVIEGRMAKAA